VLSDRRPYHAPLRRHVRLGFIIVSQSRTTQTQSSSGGGFKKTVTTTVELQQENAQTAAICVSATQTASETTGCDDPAHIAISGVAVSPWKGGSMPMDEEMVYKWVHKQSSWSIAFFAVVLAVVTWGIATVLVQGLATPLLLALGVLGFVVADESFIHLNRTAAGAKRRKIAGAHRLTNTVGHEPSRLESNAKSAAQLV